jgi:hypothetical protein
MRFIETIQDFTLGDWREIVVLSQSPEVIPTKKAWELFQEAYRRYKNRVAALAYIEARKQQTAQSSTAKASIALSNQRKKRANLEVAARNQGTKTLKQELEKGSTNALVVPQVGNPEVGHQYRTQWSKTLNLVYGNSPKAAEFLSKSAGLFQVESSRFTMNVTVEVLEEGLKLFRSQIKQPVLNECFSIGFGKPVKVMFRLPATLMNSRD